MRLYRVYETGTDDYAEGPFCSHADARNTSDVQRE